MPDTKVWWQSRIIWVQIVAALFAILSAFGLLPSGVDQEQVVAGIMAVVAIVTAVLRMRSTHTIAKPAVDPAKAGPLLALALMLGLPLSGCATTAGRVDVPAAIERADAAYARIRIAAELALPLLPPVTAARVRTAMALADQAIAAARAASDVAEQLRQMRAVERQAATIAAVTVTAD